ncbi:hypothetical protein SETIT_2G327900v2 [Setaria italica]|uniref:Endonuclease/exonuclease/phosphatase domain-containing protein n=1 Tax=Setaria italica TaxID=4555 RepID=K4A2Q3_SETIT|nr:uncharacterized protein LOC101782913 [Setaria italica]RCV13192.1 hypothetical protein SETIT_2G327900v2 [Setaria italica]
MAGIKFLTYNVWSCEHVAVYRRIRAICEIIERHDPDVIFLQLSKLNARKELLPEYSHSWAVGSPSPPHSPRAGKIPSDLLSARVYETHHRLRAATCSLAGPNPSDIGSVHRRARAGAFLEHFDAVHQPYDRSFVLDGNVVLGGDLGWDDDLDGPLRLGNEGWVDAWRELRGGDEDIAGGWTYDALANPMLRGLNLPAERRRPDRFICKLSDFKLGSIEMVGVEPILGVTRFDDKGNVLPVLPSHHFGLLLTISPKHG